MDNTGCVEFKCQWSLCQHGVDHLRIPFVHLAPVHVEVNLRELIEPLQGIQGEGIHAVSSYMGPTLRDNLRD